MLCHIIVFFVNVALKLSIASPNRLRYPRSRVVLLPYSNFLKSAHLIVSFRPCGSTYFHNQGQKAAGSYIPHHASPAVAASAAAAREAAAAGNGEIMPATSLFVRKVSIYLSIYLDYR